MTSFVQTLDIIGYLPQLKLSNSQQPVKFPHKVVLPDMSLQPVCDHNGIAPAQGQISFVVPVSSSHFPLSGSKQGPLGTNVSTDM